MTGGMRMPEVTSMQETFKKVGEHDVVIHEDILPRLEILEKEHLAFKQEMTSFQKGQKELELTVMKDGQQTRDLLGKFVDHYFGTDDKKLMINEKVTMKRLSRSEKIILGFFAILGGSGGVIAGLITLMDKLGGQ